MKSKSILSTSLYSGLLFCLLLTLPALSFAQKKTMTSGTSDVTPAEQSILSVTERPPYVLVVSFDPAGTANSMHATMLERFPNARYFYYTDPSYRNFIFLERSQSPSTDRFRLPKNYKTHTAVEVAKKKGMTDFAPFKGEDKVEIRSGKKALKHTDQVSDTNPLDLCDVENCDKTGTWSVVEQDPGTFVICGNTKKSCLCFKPDEGIRFETKAGASGVDACGQWVLTPAELGKNGAIKSYSIHSKANPDYVLAVDTRSNEVRVEKGGHPSIKYNTAEPNTHIKTDWVIITKQSGTQNQQQGEKRIREAEQK